MPLLQQAATVEIEVSLPQELNIEADGSPLLLLMHDIQGREDTRCVWTKQVPCFNVYICVCIYIYIHVNIQEWYIDGKTYSSAKKTYSSAKENVFLSKK